MFAICGAHGILTAAPGGPPVDLDTMDLFGSYFFVPQCPNGTSLAFVDYRALEDRVASTVRAPRSVRFRQEVVNRDDVCVLTGGIVECCDAVHIIPQSKGSEYIEEVVLSRRHLYPQPDIQINDINDVRNGILLTATLHRGFGQGRVAFLRTPNFVLGCDDIPRVATDDVLDLPYRITMQRIVPDPARHSFPEDDARLVGSENELPPAILLDFIYGVAAYQRWKIDDAIHRKLSSYYTDKYEKIRPELDSTESSGSEQADPSNDSDDLEGRPGMPGFLDAMDNLMDISLRVRLRTMPDEVAARLQRQEQEEELREQEGRRTKVLGWMERTDATVSDTGENM